MLRELMLEQPVLIGWSYGTIVILDYLRVFGEDSVAGISIVDGITKLGSAEALAALTPEMLDVLPGCFASETEESVRGLSGLLELCFVRRPAPEDLYPMLGYNLTVPPPVRQALLSREVDNDDLLPTIRKPVLVVHGDEDAIVRPSVVDQHVGRHRPRAGACDVGRRARAVLGGRADVRTAPARVLRKPVARTAQARFQRLRPSAAGAHTIGVPRSEIPVAGGVAEGARAHGGARRRSRGARLAGPTRRLRSAPRIGSLDVGPGCVRRRRPGSGPRAGRAPRRPSHRAEGALIAGQRW